LNPEKDSQSPFDFPEYYNPRQETMRSIKPE
jgi:hypothetical protein